jgi:hypothetical protein
MIIRRRWISAGKRRTDALVKGGHPPKSPLQRGIPEGAALRPPESSVVGVCSKLAKKAWVRVPALSCGHALRRCAPWRPAAPPGTWGSRPRLFAPQKRVGSRLGARGFASARKSTCSCPRLFAPQKRGGSRPKVRAASPAHARALARAPGCLLRKGGWALA